MLPGVNEYSRRKYLELRVLLRIQNYKNSRLNSSRPHPGTIQIRIGYNNIKKCRPLTEMMVEATSSHPLSSRQSCQCHIIISWQCQEVFLTICATAPLSLPIIRGVHLIILPAWWRRDSTGVRFWCVTASPVGIEGIIAVFSWCNSGLGSSSGHFCRYCSQNVDIREKHPMASHMEAIMRVEICYREVGGRWGVLAVDVLIWTVVNILYVFHTQMSDQDCAFFQFHSKL